MRVRQWLIGVLALAAIAACSSGSSSSGVDGSGGGNTGGSGGSLTTDCEPRTCAELGWACGMMIDECGNIVDCAEEGLGCEDGEVCVGGIDSPTECREGLGGRCDLCAHIPDCSDAPQTTVLRGRVVSPGRDDDDQVNQVGIPNAVVYILRNNDIDDLPAMSTGLPAGGEGCDRCEEQELGPVLIGGVTDAAGYFELEGNVPVGVEFLLVVKAGKFRRAVPYTIPEAGACETTNLPTTLPDSPTRLPRNGTDGLAVNIPHIAVSTGRIDAMECVFYKMGLEEEVFGAPGTDRPIHIYHGANHLDRPAGGAWPNDDQADSCAACDACSNGTGSGAQGCRADACGGSAQSAKFEFLHDNCRARACRSCAACTSSSCRTANCGGSEEDDRWDYLDTHCADYLDTRFLESKSRVESYDMVVFDCQGTYYDHDPDLSEENQGWRRATFGATVREYVNRGGRMFASHLSHTWLYENGDQPYSSGSAWETGLGPVANWQYQFSQTPNWGTGQITLPEYWDEDTSDWTQENTSPRIQAFAEWMESEGITSADDDHTFELREPRSMCLEPGEHTEVFVDGVAPTHNDQATGMRVQQFSFNTPYGAPEEAACGRVAYSGFHVSAGGGSSPFQHEMFPEHCTGSLGNDGVLSDQEKVLLYMLFDLGACVGNEPPCVPATCEGLGVQCGMTADGCGNVLNCGTCGVIR